MNVPNGSVALGSYLSVPTAFRCDVSGAQDGWRGYSISYCEVRCMYAAHLSLSESMVAPAWWLPRISICSDSQSLLKAIQSGAHDTQSVC